MIATHYLQDITASLDMQYTGYEGQKYTIDNIITHGSAMVVCFTRQYESTIGGRYTVTEHRVAVFYLDYGVGVLHKRSDMIADTTTRTSRKAQPAQA